MPIPLLLANEVRVETSAMVKTSGSTSFFPIIGVTPTSALRWAVVQFANAGMPASCVDVDFAADTACAPIWVKLEP